MKYVVYFVEFTADTLELIAHNYDLDQLKYFLKFDNTD